MVKTTRVITEGGKKTKIVSENGKVVSRETTDTSKSFSKRTGRIANYSSLSDIARQKAQEAYGEKGKEITSSGRIIDKPIEAERPSMIVTAAPKPELQQPTSMVISEVETAPVPSAQPEKKGFFRDFWESSFLSNLRDVANTTRQVGEIAEQTGDKELQAKARKFTATSEKIASAAEAFAETPFGKPLKATGKELSLSGAYVGALAIGGLPADIVITGTKGAVIVEGTKAASAATAPKSQKEIIKSEGFREAMSAAYFAEEQAINQEAWYKQLGYEISPAISNKKQVFEQTLRESFAAQGYEGEKLDTAVKAGMRQRKASTIGEAAALLEISRSSEVIGRRNVLKAFEKGGTASASKPFWGVFKKTFTPIAKAGIVEGATQEVSQSIAREQEVNAKNVFFMGAAGGASAGLIGGTIAGLRPGKPSASKVVETITYIADPFEKPGDLLADATAKAQKAITGKTIPMPVITTPAQSVLTFGVGQPSSKGVINPDIPTPTEAFNIAQTTEPFAPDKNGKTPTPVGIPGIPTPTITPTPGKPSAPTSIEEIVFGSEKPQKKGTYHHYAYGGRSGVKTPSISTIIGVPTPVKTPTPVPIPVITPTPTPTPIFTPTPTPTPIFTPTPVPVPEIIPTPVFTNTPVGVPVSIPTFTPLMRIPPPLPLVPEFPFGSGGSGTGSKRRPRKFINELSEGRRLLASVTGVGLAQPLVAMRKTKSKSKKKKKKPATDKNLSSMNRLIFGRGLL